MVKWSRPTDDEEDELFAALQGSPSETGQSETVPSKLQSEEESRSESQYGKSENPHSDFKWGQVQYSWDAEPFVPLSRATSDTSFPAFTGLSTDGGARRRRSVQNPSDQTGSDDAKLEACSGQFGVSDQTLKRGINHAKEHEDAQGRERTARMESDTDLPTPQLLKRKSAEENSYEETAQRNTCASGVGKEDEVPLIQKKICRLYTATSNVYILR